MRKRILLTLLALALASPALAGQTISPAPLLRMARPDEVPNQVEAERKVLLKGLFPGAIGIPHNCTFSLIDVALPESRFNDRITCTPMTYRDIGVK